MFQVGDIITTRNGEKNIFLDECMVDKNQDYLYMSSFDIDMNDKDGLNYSDIMKIERYIKTSDGKYDLKALYERKEEILDEKEVKCIYKRQCADYEWITIVFQKGKEGTDGFSLPNFRKNTMYKKMAEDYPYRPEQLGL